MAEGNEKVEGELWSVSKELFKELDDYENDCGDYYKREIDVHVDNKNMKAITYFFNGLTYDLPKIEKNCWIKYKKHVSQLK